MIKKTAQSIVIISLLMLAHAAQAQAVLERPFPLNVETSRIEFSDVVQVEGTNTDQLYSRARQWFVKTYKSADHVLQMDDRENGKLIGKAFTDISIVALGTPVPIKMHYSIAVLIKEGRYKYIVTDIEYQGYPQQGSLNPPRIPAEDVVIVKLRKKNGKIRGINGQYKEQTFASVESLVAVLEEAMKSDEFDTISTNDDW